MHLLSFITPDQNRQIKLGALVNGCIVDLHAARTWVQGACSLPAEDLPQSLPELVHDSQAALIYINKIISCLKDVNPVGLKSAHRARVGFLQDEVVLLPPLFHPVTIREIVEFDDPPDSGSEVHRRPAWPESPVYTYTNVNAVFGPAAEITIPSFTNKLDFSLQAACVIGKFGRNISREQASEFILGYSIMNGWAARDVEEWESALGCSPSRSRDFAVSLGPHLVTPDELSDYSTNRPGVFNLATSARLNGVEQSSGSWADIHFSFGDLIARASEDTYLVPGDVLASGVIGSGSILKTTSGKGPWLKPGDRIEIEINQLGILQNTIASAHSNPEE